MTVQIARQFVDGEWAYSAVDDPSLSVPRAAYRTLTADEINAIHTTPIEIVPAVEGRIIVPLLVISVAHVGSVRYDEGGVTWQGWIGPLGYQDADMSAIFLNIASDGGNDSNPVKFWDVQQSMTDGTGSTPARLASIPMRLSTNNPFGNTGDGTATVVVNHMLLDPQI